MVIVAFKVWASRWVRAGLPVGVLGGWLLGCSAGVPSSSNHPLAHHAFPSSREFSLAGNEVRLPPAGQVTVVDVWSTFCEPCLRGMPRLQALWTKHRGAGLAVVGVVAGTFLATRLPVARLRQGFAIMMLATGAFVLWRSFAVLT